MGGNVVIIPSYKRPIRYVKELTKLFKDGQYDIVHSNMNALSVFALMAAKKAGIKIRIAHSHSTTNKKEFFRNILKNLLRPFSKKYATHYFACSEFAGRWLFGNKTFNEGKVTIVNNAIDLKKFVYDKNIRQQIRRNVVLHIRIKKRHQIEQSGRRQHPTDDRQQFFGHTARNTDQGRNAHND